MKKQITLLRTLLLAVVLLVGSGMAWGAEVLLTELTFPAYNNSKVGSYTASWTATKGTTTWDIANYNNNNDGWAFIKAGNKTAASTATINTSFSEKITKLVVTVDALTSANITSIKLYVANNSSYTGAEVISVNKETGDLTFNIASPIENGYYKFEVVCTKGTANGLITVSKLAYYENVIPSCTTPTTSFATPTSVSKLTTDAAFTNTFTSDNTSTKVWSSTNDAVATVDAAGEVTIHSAGTASIKVNQAADATYCAVVDASYALTVTAPAVAEPTNHATSFTATTNSASQITVTWTDAIDGQLPAGYLVIASTGTPTAPVDGIAQTNAALVKNIAQGTQQAVFTGLDASTTYNFSIWPYTNSGAAIDYKIGGQPTANATTETPLGVTIATAATNVSATGFTANWGATAAATGYDVNVYTKTGGSGTTNILSENFNGFNLGAIGSGANSTDVSETLDTKTQTTGWTGSKIYDAGGTIKLGGSSSLGYITTPKLNLSANGGAFNISFKSMAWSGDATDMKIYLDDVLVSTVTPLNNDATYTLSNFSVDLSGGTATSKIKFEGKQISKGRFFLEDLVISQGSAPINSPFSGSPFTVSAVTSKAVSGLNPGTNYYYTVVAKKGAESAVASNEISVTTLTSTFTGTGDWSETARWNTASVPGTTDNVIIDGDATVSSNIEVAGLTVNASKSLTVNAGKQLTVSAALTNNGTLNLWSTEAGGTATLTAGSTSGTGIAHVSQYLKDARNWYVASPVSGADLPATGYTLYERNEANASWPTPTGTFTQGRGYIAFPDAAASTLTFSGTLNLANVDVALTWSGASSKGFNLIGNPYPSHLTWTKAFTDANVALIEPSIYYRTNGGTANNSGLWSTPTYNAFSGASVGGATAIIPPMQAVWVRAIAAGTLTLDNSKLTRSHQGSNPLKAPAVVESQKLRLVVTDGQASDEILLYFNANASNAYDRYDSPKMINGANSSIPDMYTMADNEQLVINGMSTIPTEIPLYFKANASTASQFSVSATEFSNFEVGTQVYIKNKNTSIEQLISDGTAYSFNASANPSFSIIIKAPGVISGFDNNSSINFHVFANAIGQITIASPIATGNDVVSVYNAVGQRVLSQNLTSTRTVLNKTFTSGVYVVEVNGVAHKVIVK